MGRKVLVRGAGYSAGPAADLVLSVAKLDRVLAITDDRVTVEAGITWEALLPKLTHYPPVIPGLREATIGGTLGTGGFAKGSRAHGFVIDHVLELVVVTGDGRRVACNPRQAGWLFDAVLGGHGRFGVITEATLALAPESPRFVTTSKIACATLADVERELRIPAYHATAFHAGGGWTVARTVASDEGVPFLDFALGRATPRTSQVVTQVLVPHLVDDVPAQIHLVRAPRCGLMRPKVATDEVLVVTVLADAPVPLAGTPTYLGGLPATWPAEQRLADPRGVLSG